MLKSFPAVDAGNGVTRRVLSDSPELMMVEFTYAPGGIGPAHHHVHVQSTYVQSGRYAFTVGEDTFEVGPGDSFVVPSDVVHSCRGIEPGVLIDSFSPRRDEFL